MPKMPKNMTPEQEAAWRERRNAVQRKYRKNHPEKVMAHAKAQTQRAKERDPEKFNQKRNAINKRWCKKNPEWCRKRMAEWVKNNPEKRREITLRSYPGARARYHARKEADNFFVAMATVDAIAQFPKTNEPKP